MKEEIVEGATAASMAVGNKMIAGGATTSIAAPFFGAALNSADIQLIGVVGGLMIAVCGLAVNIWKVAMERRDRLAAAKWNGEERRNYETDGYPESANRRIPPDHRDH